MSLDGAFLYMVKSELQQLVGSRVDKINQPARYEIIMSFRTTDGARKLLISANAASARIHLTAAQPDNPKTPPMFCLLMRKHFCGAKLTEITQDGLERILTLRFDATSELGDPVKLELVCEIMGRCSNLIIVNSGRVIDSIKRVGEDVSRERIMIPGIGYEAPPRRQRLSILDYRREQLEAALTGCGDKELSKALLEVFEGLSPVVVREFAYFAGRGTELFARDCTGKYLERLDFCIRDTAARLTEGRADYCIVSDKNGELKDFSFMRISQYGTMMLTRQAPSAGVLLDSFFSERDKSMRRKQRADDLFNILVNHSDKLRRKIIMQREEITACAEKEKCKLCGDLISANIYRMKGNPDKIVLENYYDNMSPVEIPLDIRLSPSQNAQKYYLQYRKKCTAEKALAVQILKAEEELIYLDSVFDSLTRADTLDDIEAIRRELYEQGYIRKNPVKGKKLKENPPAEFFSADGYRLLVGRNNKQNDILTLKTARKQDIWLHTHNIPGAHVIIETQGVEVPPQTIMQAAQLAAYHSKAKTSAQVPVDYCPVKYVKKPSNAKPGMVIFSNNKTVYVTPALPEEHENEA